jgi:predicted nucleic acid-binding Zn ribbon protein
MEKWFVDNALTVVSMFLVGVGGFFTIKFLVKELRININDIIKDIDNMKNEFDEHIDSLEPHKHCVVHTATIVAAEKNLLLKVDKTVCNEIHKNADRRFDEICDELNSLKSALSPLSSIEAGIKRIESKLKG